MNYRRQYHCLLCSSLFVYDREWLNDFTQSPEEAENLLRESTEQGIHYCDDGGIGVSVTAGYRKVTEHDIT